MFVDDRIGSDEMSSKVMIFGTVSWPHTNKAREAYGDKAVFFEVGADNTKLEEILNYSGGRRQVPVIVEEDKVTVGFVGDWGVWFAGSLPVQSEVQKREERSEFFLNFFIDK